MFDNDLNIIVSIVIAINNNNRENNDLASLLYYPTISKKVLVNFNPLQTKI